MQLGLSWMRVRKLMAGLIAAAVLAAAALVSAGPAHAAPKHKVDDTTTVVTNDPVVSYTMSFAKRGNSWS